MAACVAPFALHFEWWWFLELLFSLDFRQWQFFEPHSPLISSSDSLQSPIWHPRWVFSFSVWLIKGKQYMVITLSLISISHGFLHQRMRKLSLVESSLHLFGLSLMPLWVTVSATCKQNWQLGEVISEGILYLLGGVLWLPNFEDGIILQHDEFKFSAC